MADYLQHAKALMCQADSNALFKARELVTKILNVLPITKLDGTHMLDGWSKIMGAAAVLQEQITSKMANLNSAADDAMRLLLENDAGAANGASQPGQANTPEKGTTSPKKKKKKKEKKSTKKQAQGAAQPAASNSVVDDEQRVQKLKAEMLLARAEENACAQEWAAQRALAQEEQEQNQAPVERAVAKAMPVTPVPTCASSSAVSVAPPLCECPVCLEDYLSPPSDHMPLSLPCGHTQCRLCVEQMEAAALGANMGGGPLVVQCPECRKVLELPPGGSEALPCNYSLLRMVEAALARDAATPAAGANANLNMADKIARLELMWLPANCAAGGGFGPFIVRIEALEAAVVGASCAGALPARVAALEQHSGL
jgi:hypothetical protein